MALSTIPYEVAVLIPKVQLKITKDSLRDFWDGVESIETALKKCPAIRETDGMKEHPAIFHYFYGSTDLYICEYDKKDYMFGYAILNGDLDNSEWGYFDLTELTNTMAYNIDYYFEEQSIEAALYKKYPNRFKKPLSLKKEFTEKLADRVNSIIGYPNDRVKFTTLDLQ